MSSTSSEPGSVGEYEKLVPVIWTVLRLIGVYFTIIGGSAVIEDLAGIVAYWRHDLNNWFLTGTLFDYFTPRLFGNAFYLAGGIYLLVGGRWLIEKVFLPAETPDSTNGNNHTDSELTGRPRDPQPAREQQG